MAIYLSQNGVAKKAKKVYVGVNGSAVPIYPDPDDLKPTSINPLMSGTGGSVPFSLNINNKYVIAMGTVFDTQLLGISKGGVMDRQNYGVGSIGRYGIYGGGQYYQNSSTNYYDITAMDDNLVTTTIETIPKSQSTSFFSRKLTFSGKAMLSRGSMEHWCYDANLVKSVVNTDLNPQLPTTVLGDYSYLLKADTTNGYGYQLSISVYNYNLVKTNTVKMGGSYAYNIMGCGHSDNKAYFVKNQTSQAPYNQVDVFNSSLVRCGTDIKVDYAWRQVTQLNSYAIFNNDAGNQSSGTPQYDTCWEYIDKNMIVSGYKSGCMPRAIAPVTFNNYVLLAGGITGQTSSYGYVMSNVISLIALK